MYVTLSQVINIFSKDSFSNRTLGTLDFHRNSLQAEGKDTSNDALPKFLAQYASAQRVGSLIKETPSGKLVSEWQTVVNESSSKPQLVDMAPAISALMGIKDEEEIVGFSISSAVIRN